MHEKSPSQPENGSESLHPQDLKIAAGVPFIQFIRSEWFADFYSSVNENGNVEFAVFRDPLFGEDEAYRQFESEVQKMAEVKANTKAAISLVLGYGLAGSGSFPYLETTVPEGVVLSELCNLSPETVYSLSEIATICSQLSKALAHCHNSGLLHGAINSKHVWLDHEFDQYGFCGFGASFLTPSRRAERMATITETGFPPEQLNGDLLYQTDIYSFSTLIFNLLLARPNGEPPVEILSARENFYKDLVHLRTSAIASLDWTEDKKATEGAVPRWMMDLIYNSLHKNPRNRFSHGIKLYDFVLLNHLLAKENSEEPRVYHRPRVKEKKVKREKSTNKFSLAALGLAILLATGFLFTRMGSRQGPPYQQVPAQQATASQTKQSAGNMVVASPKPESTGKPELVLPEKKEKVSVNLVTASHPVIAASKRPISQPSQNRLVVTPKIRPEDTKGHCSTLDLNTGLGDYKVKSLAYFHTKPDEGTRRNAFINHWNNTVLHALKEENDFIYIVFTNYWGQTSKGWLKKTDVIPMNQDPSSALK